MNEFYYKLPKSFIGKVISNKEFKFGTNEKILLEAYVPGIKITKEKNNPDSIISHTEGPQKEIDSKDSNIQITDEWKNSLPSDLYHLLGGIARKHYLQNRLFPVHAAAVGLEDLALIVGHSGSGKTAVTWELLCDNWKLYSGNKTVVEFSAPNKLQTVAGTKTMTGKESEYSNMPNSYLYGNRVAFQMDPSQYSKGGNIKSIILVNLQQHMKSFEKINPVSATHQLYPFFLDAVNADVILGGEKVFDGAIDFEIKELLAGNLNTALKHIPTYQAKGSPEYIANKIKEIHL